MASLAAECVQPWSFRNFPNLGRDTGGETLREREQRRPVNVPGKRPRLVRMDQRPPAMMAEIVKTSSTVPPSGPLLKYQPSSPGTDGDGSRHRVAWLSC